MDFNENEYVAGLKDADLSFLIEELASCSYNFGYGRAIHFHRQDPADILSRRKGYLVQREMNDRGGKIRFFGGVIR